MWEPDADYLNQIEQLIARPLRRCLRLPQSSTHALSTLVECGVLSVAAAYALAAVRFGALLHKSSPDDPCRQFFERKTNYVAVAIRRCETQMNLKTNDAKSMLTDRTAADNCQMQEWRFGETGSKYLKGCKLVAGPSLYLLRDTRRVTAIRARLRLDRPSLNASLAQRRVVTSKTCPECKASEETIEHCLLECPRYANARQTCRSELAAIQMTFDLPTILADVEKLKSPLPNKVLTITAKFLTQIDQLRRL
jgi:hypothetical protein